jgi:ribonuclease R
MKKFPSEDQIGLEEALEVLRSHKGRALHVMEVCARLGADASQRDAVRVALETLEEEGLVQQMPGLRFKALRVEARPKPSLRSSDSRRVAPTARVGILRIHARGHGFVAPEDGAEDIFIAPGELLGALHGDRVAVATRRGERGFEGTVVAVLGRNLRYVAGLMQQGARGELLIVPNDARLPRVVHVVGKVPGDAVPGLEVVGEIVAYPEDGSSPEARIVRVLGIEGSAEVEVAKIKLREGILEEFPEAALEEARAFGGRVSPKERKGRIDLRHLDLVTIDPKTARDHDDAIYIARSEAGGYRVVVAIADVSHYVCEGGAVDTEARARSTSIYLPDRAIPMLPPELSTELASLVAHKDRLTLALDMELAANGTVRSFRYVEGLMRCKASLTYEGVAQALGLTQQGRNERAAVQLLPMLEVLYECAMILRSRRMKRGSLDFDLPEPSVELEQDTGEPSSIKRSRKDPGIRKAYQLVEEMMLLANETVAADLAARKVPGIYRVHGLPDQGRLEQFAGLAQALGYALDPEDVTSPRELATFLQKLDDSPHKSSLSYLLLRAMQQASYDTVNIGHFGLAAKHYLHFTSPIRRYPDLAVHRVVRKLARGEPIDSVGLERKLSEQASAASKLERRAMLVEREVIDVYRCILVKDRIGEEFEATVSGVAPHGIYCSFDEPFVEALCHVSALGNDFYELDTHGLRLVGRRSGASYGLGDRLTVRLESVNVAERAILAAPVIYVHPDELSPSGRSLDPVHEGGYARLKRRERERKQAEPARAESRTSRPAPSRKQKSEKQDERKKDRRRERRTKDERKQQKRRRR